jgi:hypothetical protein
MYFTLARFIQFKKIVAFSWRNLTGDIDNEKVALNYQTTNIGK